MRKALSAIFLAALAAAPAAAAEEVPAFNGDVLNFALDACAEQDMASWAPARRGAYLDSVVSYHQSAWEAQGVEGGLAAYELLNENGDPVNLALPSGENFEAILIKTAVYGNGVKVSGCAIYLNPHEALSIDEMREWSSRDPSERLIGVAANESSWELGPPDGSGWDYTYVSAFDPAVPQSSNAAPHPFHGLVIRFVKMEF